MVQLLNRQSQIVSPWLAGILCIQFALLLYQAYRWSPVYDEWGQLPAGLHSLRTGDQSPYSVNPPLVRYCAAAVVYPFTKPFSVALQIRRPEWKLGDDFESIPVPLPYHLLIGLDIQKTDFESKMPSYFMGTWRDHGWYQYYVVAWLLKEPPVFWLLVLLGGLKGGWLRRDEWLLVAPGLLILGFVSSQTGFNHHLRYTLPVFPALVIFAVRWLRPNSFHRAVAFSLVSVYVLSMVSVYPRTYCYFTELVGGASQGWRYLGDSNLDWGQDMRTVHEWLQRNPDKQPVLGFRSTPFGNSLHPYVIKPAVQSCVELDGVCYPKEAGWWLMPKRAFIENSSEWFRKQPASEVLSLTYSVYYIDQSMIDSIEMPMR